MQNRPSYLLLAEPDAAAEAGSVLPEPATPAVGAEGPFPPWMGDAPLIVDQNPGPAVSGAEGTSAALTTPDSDTASAITVGSLSTDHFSWDGIDLDQVLRDRPDVLSGYYQDYFGPNNDRHSTAWIHRVGGRLHRTMPTTGITRLARPRATRP